MKSNQISVIISVHNQIMYTKECLKNLRYSLEQDKYIYNIIVVDSASDDGTYEWLKAQPGITILRSEEIVSVSKAYNTALKLVKTDLVLFLHNDVMITPKAIKALDGTLRTHRELVAIGPLTNSDVYDYQTIEDNVIEYHNYNELCFAVKKLIDNTTGNPMVYSIGLGNFCFLVKKESLDAIHGFDEKFFIHYMEDLDVSYRLIKSGGDLGIAPNVYVHHICGGTTSCMKETRYQIMEKMRSLFKAKWGFDFIYSYGIRKDLLSRIDYEKNTLSILDIGCGMGGNFTKIKVVRPDADLYGIEICPQSACIAQAFANVTNCDVNKIDMSKWKNKFDYIIMGDVLEHTPYPCDILKKLYKVLRDDGVILASIPNIVNFATLYKMLNGRFEYEDDGVLDRTHLRFFTKIDAIKMFEDCGYNAEIVDHNYMDMSGTDDKVKQLQSIDWINLDDDDLKTIQYIIVAKK